MQRFFSNDCPSDKNAAVCLTSLNGCCRDPILYPAGSSEPSLGWKLVETLRKWTFGLLAIGSTFIALMIHYKNKKLQRRLDIIREDWKNLKQERLRLKSELCRLKRSKSGGLDEEANRPADMTVSFADSFRERNQLQLTQSDKLRRELVRLQRELEQSYKEREMLTQQLQKILRKSCTSSFE